MASEQQILLVEDDPVLALGLVDALEFEGFTVSHAQTGQEAISLARSARPTVIILDLMLPDMNGYQVCEQVRGFDARVPILILSARSQEADKIRGLDAGADDFVTKPFSLGELVARIRALLRRVGRNATTSFTIGGAEIDPVRQVMRVRGRERPLGFYEVELLKVLVARAGEPVSREELLETIWGLEASPTNRTVDNFIVKLRKKLEPKPNDPRHILTVYGVGYKLVV